MSEVELVTRVPHSKLSEGIIVQDGVLHWVDIRQSVIYRKSLAEGDAPVESYRVAPATYNGAYPYPGYQECCGVVFPLDTAHVLFGARFGIGKLNWATGAWEYVLHYRQAQYIATNNLVYRLRSNDGNVSPCGRYIYVGLMNWFDLAVQPEGCLLKCDLRDRTVTTLIPRMKIPNSINYILSDPQSLYVTDSLNFAILKYDLSSNTCETAIDVRPSNSQFSSPEPDGSVVDYNTNYLYTAVWSTSKVQCYNLQTAQLLKEYVLPVPRISCCCLYGDDLFVTTANLNIDSDSDEDTVGGSIYRIKNARIDSNSKIENTRFAITESI